MDRRFCAVVVSLCWGDKRHFRAQIRALLSLASKVAMIYVLDQNYLRTTELETLVATEPGATFVLPDVALLEMCKGEKWRDVMQMSLATLSQCPTRVFHSLSVGEALNSELQTLKSIHGRLLPRELKKFIRSILEDISAGTSTNGIATLTSGMVKVQEEVRSNELNHERNQASLLTRTKIIKDVLGAKALRQLKNGLDNDTDRLKLVYRIAFDLASSHLKNEGVSDNKIKVFLKTKPLLLRYFLLSVRHPVEWAKTNGLDSMSPDKITNDILDQQYVVIASFFDAILSRETRVRDADADLRALLRMDT
jgi:hypothetical protein